MLTFQSDSPRIRGQFNLNAGIVAVVGLSGSGKTSLFRLLTGLDHHQTVRVQVNHQSLHQLAVWDRPIAYVPQKPSLIPHRTIASQVAWINPHHQERFEMWQETLGLTPLLSRYPSDLSGGEQQRAALLRAINADRPILLLDEALSGVDRPHRTAIFQKLVEWWPNDQLLLFSTHDWKEAEQFSQQLLYIEDGRVDPPILRRDIHPLTEKMARLMGFVGVLTVTEGKILLHPNLVRPGPAEGAFFIPGELIIEEAGPLQCQYSFRTAGQEKLWQWYGPWEQAGQFNGLSLTQAIWGKAEWEGDVVW